MSQTSPAVPPATVPETSPSTLEPSADVPVAVPAPKPPRHPLAGLLTVLTALVALGVAAVVTIGSIALVRTQPATGRTHTISVLAVAQHVDTLVSISTSAGAAAVQLTGTKTKDWQVDVPFGDTITVDMVVQTTDVYSDDDTDMSGSQVTCTLRDGDTVLASNTGTTTGRAASCMWHNG